MKLENVVQSKYGTHKVRKGTTGVLASPLTGVITGRTIKTSGGLNFLFVIMSDGIVYAKQVQNRTELNSILFPVALRLGDDLARISSEATPNPNTAAILENGNEIFFIFQDKQYKIFKDGFFAKQTTLGGEFWVVDGQDITLHPLDDSLYTFKTLKYGAQRITGKVQLGLTSEAGGRSKRSEVYHTLKNEMGIFIPTRFDDIEVKHLMFVDGKLINNMNGPTMIFTDDNGDYWVNINNIALRDSLVGKYGFLQTKNNNPITFQYLQDTKTFVQENNATYNTKANDTDYMHTTSIIPGAKLHLNLIKVDLRYLPGGVTIPNLKYLSINTDNTVQFSYDSSAGTSQWASPEVLYFLYDRTDENYYYAIFQDSWVQDSSTGEIFDVYSFGGAYIPFITPEGTIFFGEDTGSIFQQTDFESGKLNGVNIDQAMYGPDKFSNEIQALFNNSVDVKIQFKLIRVNKNMYTPDFRTPRTPVSVISYGDWPTGRSVMPDTIGLSYYTELEEWVDPTYSKSYYTQYSHFDTNFWEATLSNMQMLIDGGDLKLTNYEEGITIMYNTEQIPMFTSFKGHPEIILNDSKVVGFNTNYRHIENRETHKYGLFPVMTSKPKLYGYSIPVNTTYKTPKWTTPPKIINGKFYFVNDAELTITNTRLEWDKTHTLSFYSTITDIETLGNQILVFTTAGVYTLTGEIISNINAKVGTPTKSFNNGSSLVYISADNEIIMIQKPQSKNENYKTVILSKGWDLRGIQLNVMAEYNSTLYIGGEQCLFEITEAFISKLNIGVRDIYEGSELVLVDTDYRLLTFFDNSIDNPNMQGDKTTVNIYYLDSNGSYNYDSSSNTFVYVGTGYGAYSTMETEINLLNIGTPITGAIDMDSDASLTGYSNYDKFYCIVKPANTKVSTALKTTGLKNPTSIPTLKFACYKDPADLTSGESCIVGGRRDAIPLIANVGARESYIYGAKVFIQEDAEIINVKFTEVENANK